MDLFVWMGQTVLAVIFAVLGPLKLQYETFVTRGWSAWAKDVPKRQVQLIGILETLGAVALVWPLATRTVPWLSVVAALCLSALMGCASYFHTRRGETNQAGVTVVLGILALLVAIGIAF